LCHDYADIKFIFSAENKPAVVVPSVDGAVGKVVDTVTVMLAAPKLPARPDIGVSSTPGTVDTLFRAAFA
jgi:hypothetical protein